MPDHIVHVGFHKSASTWLQRRVFPDVRGAVYAMEHPVLSSLVGNLLGKDPFLPGTFRAAVEEFGKRLLFANEALVGHPWSWSHGADVLSERLARVLPQAHIIIVTRREQDLVQSLYAQYVYRGGAASFATFQSTVLKPEYLQIDKTVAYYRTQFENVLVVPYERLRSDAETVVSEMGNFAGVTFPRVDLRRENVSLTGWRLSFLRAWNRAFRASALHPDPLVPVPLAGQMRKLLRWP